MKKEKTKTCDWCFQIVPEKRIDEHLENSHNDFRHKRK